MVRIKIENKILFSSLSPSEFQIVNPIHRYTLELVRYYIIHYRLVVTCVYNRHLFTGPVIIADVIQTNCLFLTHCACLGGGGGCEDVRIEFSA